MFLEIGSISLGLSLIARARQKAVRRARSVPSQRAHNVVGCAHRSLGGKGQQKPIEVTEGRFVYTNSQALQRHVDPETRNINAVQENALKRKNLVHSFHHTSNETNSLSQRQLAGQCWGNLITPALAAVPCSSQEICTARTVGSRRNCWSQSTKEAIKGQAGYPVKHGTHDNWRIIRM